MVENETGNSAESVEPASTPRRRRAASRPAGPPPAVANPFQAPQTAAAPAPVTTAAAEKSSEKSAEPTAEAPEKKPATRRRAASRPAAAPDAEVKVEVAKPAEAEAAVEKAEAPAAKKPATRRRAATRPAAAPEEKAEQPAEAKSDAPAVEEPEKKPATRRRRSTRATEAPEPEVKAEESSDEPAEIEDPIAAVLREAEAAAASRPAGRRRAVRKTSAPVVEESAPEPVVEEIVEEEATPAEPEDEIAAALRAAEEAAKARKAAITDPAEVPADSRKAQLDALAGAIAAGDSDSDEEESGDESADDETSEDEESGDESADDETSEDEESQDDSDEAAESGDDSDEDSGDDSDEDSESDEELPSRRRRRRGGRRRRRGGSRSDSDSDQSDSDSDDSDPESTDTDSETDADSDSEDSEDNGDNEDSADSAEGTTRRRRRRRRGSSSRSSDEGGTSNDEITGIEGSTRMEAKRQRRKENRAAGRRRAPILSEAEFLARRESVDRKMVIRQGEDYTQLAVVEDNILVEHYVDRASATSMIGNVYLGRVQNVLPSMEAAFIDIGRGRNAVLYAGEVDWDSFGVSAEDRKVEKVFKSGQAVLVQATKDPVGAKGARLTGHISLPGRYVVYSPGGHLSGISRKLPDVERTRLREILAGVITDDESVIVRTAAEGASSDELVRDVNRLKAQWEVIEKNVKAGKAPQTLYSEPDLTLRTVRDLFTEDFGKLIVQGNGGPDDSYDAIHAYVGHVAPHLLERLERFEPTDDGKDVFTEFRIDEQIAKALDRKVYLPSGGSLVIDRTEAMTVIDVNTGRFTGTAGNLEATVTSNNLEAAEEIVRQLRLRDLGGIIVIDFIDMVLPSNRELLLRRLVECLGRDRTRHQVAEVTSLGLVQMTRKKIGTGLAEAFTETCEHCGGSGYHRFDEPVESQAQADGGDRRGGGGGGSSRSRGGRRRGGSGSQNNSGSGKSDG